MTDPYDPSLPRSSSDLGGPPGTGPRVSPPAVGSDPSTTAGSSHPAPGFNEKGHVRATKTSGIWIGLIATALFVILLIIFIAQNSRRVTINFFGWEGQFSLALAVLLAAVLGILLVAIPGSLRIMQLRRALRKNVPGGRSLD